MYAVAVRYDLRLPEARSLKEKRKILRHLIDGLFARFRIAIAEVGVNDLHQRACIGIAVVSCTAFGVEKVIHQVNKYIEANHGIEIIDCTRYYLEEA